MCSGNAGWPTKRNKNKSLRHKKMFYLIILLLTTEPTLYLLAPSFVMNDINDNVFFFYNTTV